MALKPIAPGVTNQVPPQPPMWRGPSVTVSASGPPENYDLAIPKSSADQSDIDVDDLIDPFGSQSGMERLGAAYCIRANLPYHEPANYQPTRASEFYGWNTGR